MFLDFYPRPPRGGRLKLFQTMRFGTKFLSTPSARRATQRGPEVNLPMSDFYPRPPRGGRPNRVSGKMRSNAISIHALREEGDLETGRSGTALLHFYPRPPRGGRLRVLVQRLIGCIHFYPRPPRGGRRLVQLLRLVKDQFLSTPSARRATNTGSIKTRQEEISIHALREEGDPGAGRSPDCTVQFLSTPSARRATFSPHDDAP